VKFGVWMPLRQRVSQTDNSVFQELCDFLLDVAKCRSADAVEVLPAADGRVCSIQVARRLRMESRVDPTISVFIRTAIRSAIGGSIRAQPVRGQHGATQTLPQPRP